MKKVLAIFLILVTLLAVAPVPSAASAATEVTLAGITTVPVGQTVKWSATVLPQDATNTSVTWKSWYPAVASVDTNGVITGHKPGQAHISAIASNGVKKTCTIYVSDPYASAYTSEYASEPKYAESYSYTVYITRTGAKYHRGSCRYLRKSKIAISYSSARASGYTACSVCRP